MKILTKEEEAAHYRATLIGGTVGGVAGLLVGTAGVALAQRRYALIRNLTLPMKAFLVTSSGTFAGIINADSASRKFESDVNPLDREFKAREAAKLEAERAGKTFTERMMDFGRRERYKIVGASWLGSMGVAFALVNRNKYLTGPQKIVQARVYAQFLTLGVLVATAAFEISDAKSETGRFETVRYLDPNDPEHKRYLEKRVELEAGQSQGGRSENDDLWKDMVAAEEARMKEREERVHEHHAQVQAQHKKKNGNGNGHSGEKKKAKHEGEEEEQEKGN